MNKNLNNEYKKLRKRKGNRDLIAGLFGLTLIFSLILAVVIIFAFLGETIINFWWVVVFFTITIPIIIYLTKKQENYSISNRQFVFLVFYSLYKNINELNVQLEKYEKVLPAIGSRSYFHLKFKKFLAKRSFNILVREIDSWTIDDAPEAFKKIPTSISKNLREKIFPIIDKEDTTKLEIYSKSLEDDCELLSKREPTFEEWEKVSLHLESIEIEIRIIRKKRKKIQLIFFTRPEINFPIIFAILFGLMIYYENNPGLSVVLSLSASFVGSAYLRKFKQNRPTIKSN